MTKTITLRLAVLIPLAGAQACAQNSNVDLGRSVTGANLLDYVDQWDGYTEAQEFVFGSDRVRLTIAGDGQGAMMLGEAQAYPAATNPDVGYPPNEDFMSSIVKIAGFRPGFEYPVHGVKVESSRIRFNVSLNDFFGSWCRLQVPIPSTSGGSPGFYFCGPDGYGMGDGGMCSWQGTAGMNKPIDCLKASLCVVSRVCVCTATSCAPSLEENIQFDAALREEGTQLEGTFNHATVRMQRQ